MMAERSQFQLVSEDSESDVGASTTATATDGGGRGNALAIGAVMLALQSLSKRALIAIDNLFCLLTVFSVFWLWASIPDPNQFQLIGLAMYALFVLTVNWIVRRK